MCQISDVDCIVLRNQVRKSALRNQVSNIALRNQVLKKGLDWNTQALEFSLVGYAKLGR